VRIFFAMLNPGYVRNYESAIRLLAERGHAVHLAFSQPWKQVEDRLAERLAAEYANVTLGAAPKRTDAWTGFARGVRYSMDYLRYLDPRYRHATKLRERALVWPFNRLLAWTRLPVTRNRVIVELVMRVLRLLERALPRSRNVEEVIEAYGADLVLVTPLVSMGSSQVDYVKSARALGIRSALCVASWDNLTNKGLIRVQPDRVVVWNEIQRREAVELHGMDPSSVVVTGAQRFDEWFGREPSASRVELCARAGLDPQEPFFLYVCSSQFIAPDEVSFVREWLREARSSGDSRLGRVGVMVRPHPQNARQWEGVDLSAFGNVAIWPAGGANPVDAESKRDYFDSLFHSIGVVGVNTSALIEAGIVGRPAYTLLSPRFDETQRGTLHFHHLVAAGRGLLQVAETFDEHFEQLGAALDGRGPGPDVARRFVESFVRPHGLDVACTPILVDTIEDLGRQGKVRPAHPPRWGVPIRLALLPVVTVGVRLWARVRSRGGPLSEEEPGSSTLAPRGSFGETTEAAADRDVVGGRV
jgi:hypothetical protein